MPREDRPKPEDFGEPWRIPGPPDYPYQAIIRRDLSQVFFEHTNIGLLRRVMACVNACKGMSTENLEAVARGEILILLGNSKQLQESIQNAPCGQIVPLQPPPFPEDAYYKEKMR